MLELDETDIAAKILPAALAKHAEDEDRAALSTLAAKLGQNVRTMMHDHAYYAIARHLFKGAPSVLAAHGSPMQTAVRC